MASLNTPQSCIIVGGSLGGLMHALALLSLPNPPKVRILERSTTALMHDQGAGIIAGNETQQFIDSHIRPGREVAVPSRSRHYLDRAGADIPEASEPRAQRTTSWDLLYHLLRWRVCGHASAHTRGLAADGRPQAAYDGGCAVTGVEDAGPAGVRLTWREVETGEQRSATADMVVAADGASSTLRALLAPDVRRRYAGYVAWRGTVPEALLSEAARAAFVEKLTFFHTAGSQILGYVIPGPEGSLAEGERLFNWVWYENYAADSAELQEVMTDSQGRLHAITLPVGGVQAGVWEEQKRRAQERLPPQFGEAVGKTRMPFVQAITDVLCPRSVFLGGKVLLVGDALAGFRPHTAASTSQAAFDALTLGELMEGRIDWTEYESRLVEHATRMQKRGVELGQRSQFGVHPFSR